MLDRLFRVLKLLNRDTIALRHMRNRAKVVNDYVHRRSVVRGYPFVLHIEVTNKCNLECKMCPRKNMEREEGFMEFSLFKKIVDEAKGKIEFVELYLFGEPLLHPRIFDMIAYCRDAAMRVGLSTNATVLTQPKSRALVESNVDLLILSLDGVTEKSYESIRAKGNYRKTLRNVEYLLRIRSASSPKHTVVQMIRMRENAHEVDKFSDFWSRRGVHIHLKPLLTWRGDIRSINVLQGNRNDSSVSGLGPCDRIWRHFTVFWDGTVVPCHFMYDKKCTMGNISDKSLLQLWNGEKFVDFRRRQIHNLRANVSCCERCLVRPLRGWELIAAVALNIFALRSINTILHYN